MDTPKHSDFSNLILIVKFIFSFDFNSLPISMHRRHGEQASRIRDIAEPAITGL